jgi:hypothetical protein
VLLGAVALLVGLAFVVGRANVRRDGESPYVGVRGASRVKAAGLEIFYLRGTVERVVEPKTLLRAGDRLRLVARGERPRYVEVRVRDGETTPVILFPAEGTAPEPIKPKQTLPTVADIGPAPGKVTVTALFSDQPRPRGAPPDAETDVVTLNVGKE